ncbi:MAG: M15 family metallopeptidase [Nocardioidaceae bacterium]
MTTYSRSDYGNNPNAGKSRNNAAERGWGSGWPNAQTARMAKVGKAGVTVYVRREIAPLVAVLLDNTERLFKYDIKKGQTWGFANRAIRGTRTPSNHSWGLAIDINSLANPMGSRFVTDIPPAVVAMWGACGLYWGGRYQKRPDAMHFEYIGRPRDVAADLLQAQRWAASTSRTAAVQSRSAAAPPRGAAAAPSSAPTAVRDVTITQRAVQMAVNGKPLSGQYAYDVAQFMAFASPAGLKAIPWTTYNKWRKERSWSRGVWYAVIRVQQVKQLKADGIFGPRTAKAVEKHGYRCPPA